MANLSIYIPVYNGEKYIEKCLESVINQSYRDIEIYIYNDGSQDNSLSICQRYSEKDTRIILETGENGHSIEKMNEFIQKAKGKYIGFVDHDDELALDFFEQMISYLEKTEADCAISSYTYIDEKGSILPWYSPELKTGEILYGKDTFKRFLTSLDIEGFRWNKVYKKEFLIDSKICFINKFPADIYPEAALLSKINKAVLVGTKGYYYRQSTTSEVAKCRVDNIKGFTDAFSRVMLLGQQVGCKTEAEYYLTWRCINSLFNAVKGYKMYPLEEFKKFCKSTSVREITGNTLPQSLKLLSHKYDKKSFEYRIYIKAMIVYAIFR